MIIDKNDYFNFIDKNENITNCQKKILKHYFNNLNIFYVNRKSNIQIKTLISNCKKKNYLIKIAKIKNLFYVFFNKEFSDNLFNNIFNQKMNDLDIINYIIKNTEKSKILFNPKSKLICNEWTYIIQYLVLIYKKLNKNVNNIKYLDIGCGSGNKTNKFANLLNIDYKNVYGADINNWGPYNQKEYTHKFNFIQISEDKIDIKDDSIDLISCILMLHHVKNLDIFIKEIKKKLKKDGILLIIEHNNYDDYDNLILDVLHLLYGYLYDKNNRYLIKPDWAFYYNSYEWNYILDKNGFVIIETNSLFTELSNDIRYDNLFYSFYKKK
jgi:ubiquinone/menaquinone biosynthesis C-methylase UbiE